MPRPYVQPHSETVWSAMEVADAATIRRVQEDKLREQVAYLASRSAFYQAKQNESGVALAGLTSVEALADFPFTEKTELRASLAASPPLGTHVAATMDEIVQVQASSGTTGSPSYMALTESDVLLWGELGARALYANGLRPGDVLMHGFSLSKGFVGGVSTWQIARYMGMVDLPIGAEAGAERILRSMKDFRPQALIGTPYFLAYLAERAEEVISMPANQLGLRAISVGGEPGGGIPAVRQKIEALWGATEREMLGGSDLAPSFWGECAQGDGMHLLFPDKIIAELIDPDTGAVLPVEEGGMGELVYTALERRASPLLRFRTRDHVVVTGLDCACGRTGYKIQCVGRTDDMLIVRGINVFPSAIKEIVADLAPRTSGELRIMADFEGHSTNAPLPVHIEAGPATPADEFESLGREVHDKLRSALNFTPHVTVVKEGTFPRPDHVKIQLIQRVTA